MTRRVYLDYSATTPVDPRVREAMAPYLDSDFGNPNSLYAEGRIARTALEEAREKVADLLGAEHPNEVVFTSGGTEGDNTAVLGIPRRVRPQGGHVIISAFEHHAVMEPAERLAKQGHTLTEVRPGKDGVVSPDSVGAALRDDTTLVSIMHGNNELGSLQPLEEISAIVHEAGAFLHTDAAQTLGKVKFDVETLGVDAAAFSGHKIYAPKGTGVLYVRRRTPIEPLLIGGGQEFKLRSSTQSVAGAVAFAAALEIMVQEMSDEMPRLARLRDRISAGVLSTVEGARETVSAARRLPNILHLIIPGVEGDTLLLQLDELGFAVSTGSACSSASPEPSHVLTAIGASRDDALGSLRVSVGRFTTDEDVDLFLAALPGTVTRLREMSAGRTSRPRSS